MSISEKQLAANRLNAKKAHAAKRIFKCIVANASFEDIGKAMMKGGNIKHYECTKPL